MNWFEILVIAGIFINVVILVMIYNCLEFWLKGIISRIYEVQVKMKD